MGKKKKARKAAAACAAAAAAWEAKWGPARIGAAAQLPFRREADLAEAKARTDAVIAAHHAAPLGTLIEMPEDPEVTALKALMAPLLAEEEAEEAAYPRFGPKPGYPTLAEAGDYEDVCPMVKVGQAVVVNRGTEGSPLSVGTVAEVRWEKLGFPIYRLGKHQTCIVRVRITDHCVSQWIGSVAAIHFGPQGERV